MFVDVAVLSFVSECGCWLSPSASYFSDKVTLVQITGCAVMATSKARGDESRAQEELVHELAAALLEVNGFRIATPVRQRGMKLIDAKCADGSTVRFWLKKGWSYEAAVSAIQFGFVPGRTSSEISDKDFLDTVQRTINSAKAAGADYAMLVQLGDGFLRNCFALPVDALYDAYAEQLARWPTRARNGKSPHIYFVDTRNQEASECVKAVQSRAVNLGRLALNAVSPSSTDTQPESEDGMSHMRRAVNVRLLQRQFRQRVGEAYGWRCAVSNCALDAVLEAAHLPGRNWREHNRAKDGVLLRVDLHKLLDCGLARLKNGFFLVDATVRQSEYGQFHGARVRQVTADV